MTLPVLYPMGAVSIKPEKLELLWEDKNYIAERKYDGSRYLIRKENDKVSVVSRQKSKSTGFPVDKTENVPHLVEIFSKLPNGTILDGEIITHENCTSNDVTSIMGSKPDRAWLLQKERGFVKYVMFDILFYYGHDLRGFPYNKRRKALQELHFKLFNDFTKEWFNPMDREAVLLAPIYTEDLEAVHTTIVEGGGEGIILKNLNATYVEGKKPRDTWVKVKKYDTYDCVVMGFTEPTREYSGKDIETWQYWWQPEMNDFVVKQNNHYTNMQKDGFIPVTRPFWNGWCGAIVFGQYKDGELVEVGQTSGIDDDTKHMLSHNPSQYIGQVIEVGAMEQIAKTGALRHPRFLHFRNDKNPEDCILGEV
jgi:ATP-dependent DNA ligase